MKDAESMSKKSQEIILEFFSNPETLQTDFDEHTKVERNTHPLVKDRMTEVVYSFVPTENMRGPHGGMSYGAFTIFMDCATSYVITTLDPKFRLNVSSTIDVKPTRQIPIGKRFYTWTKVTHFDKTYCMTAFITYDSDGNVCNSGSHSKVYIDSKPRL